MTPLQYDLYRIKRKTDRFTMIKTFFLNRTFRRLCYFRKYQEAGKIGKRIISFFCHFLFVRMSIELPWSVELGKGVLLLHPYGITFNSKCKVGDNCTILKGATIGNSMTGRPGSPVIGNNVYIGLNATVVGGITVGNDVMIAANTFVNFDVPDGALVIGSPGKIHLKEKASREYTLNSIEAILS